MSLSKTQREFNYHASALAVWAHDVLGVELTDGDAYRDVRLHGQHGTKKGYGASKSNHKIRLARDYNLFVDDEYITDGDHELYLKLGEKWESMHPLARWGGRFQDANHFSFEYWGCK